MFTYSASLCWRVVRPHVERSSYYSVLQAEACQVNFLHHLLLANPASSLHIKLKFGLALVSQIATGRCSRVNQGTKDVPDVQTRLLVEDFW
jgi:hypothetical protein